jgi:hypothetical protein
MNIGTFSTIGGNKNCQQLGHDFVEQIPAGNSIIDTRADSSFHLPFSRKEVYYDDKRHYPVIPEIAGHFHDTKYKVAELNQKNPTVGVFNDLQNYNPTQGITYFHPHETDVLFQHDFSRPRLESERVYDISIPQQIEAVKKDTTKTATLPQHSFTIKRRYRT